MRWILVLAYSLACFAQDTQPFRPYVFAGLGLNGGGYSAASGVGGAGVTQSSRKLIFDLNGLFNTMSKAFDGTKGNLSGYQYHIGSDLFVRVPRGFYIGGGESYSATTTTNYHKEAWHPRAGGGKDFLFDRWSMRGQIVYVLPGSDWKNGVQGPEISYWVPSPLTSGHWFWRETVGIYTFHDTVTDPNNKPLSDIQRSRHSVATFLQFTAMYRF